MLIPLPATIPNAKDTKPTLRGFVSLVFVVPFVADAESRLHEIHHREWLPKDRGRLRAEPVLQHRRVDGAEVDRILQVPVVQILEAGKLAVEAAAHPAAEDDHGAGRTMVGA